MSTFFSLKRVSALVAGVSFLLSPMSAVIAQESAISASNIQACRTAVLREYQEDLTEATGAFRATMASQWERQVGFRLRAATVARRTTVERALRTSGRRQEELLATAIQTFVRSGSADTNQLTGFLQAADPSVAFERWADRAMPTVDGLRRPLNAMEISLRLYANTRDRGVIRNVWQDTLRKALAELKEDYVMARGALAHGFMTCDVDPVIPAGDDTNTDADTDATTNSGGVAGATDDGANSAAGASANTDRSMTPVGAAGAANAGTSHSASASAGANANPVAGASTGPNTRITPGGVAGAAGANASPAAGANAGPNININRTPGGVAGAVSAPVLTRVRVFAVTEAVTPASTCAATVLSRAEIEGTPGMRVQGRFYFEDDAVSEEKMVTLDASGRGAVEFRRHVRPAGVARILTGRVRFIAESGNIIESGRVTYSHECPAINEAAARNDAASSAASPATAASASGAVDAASGGTRSATGARAVAGTDATATPQATADLYILGADRSLVCGSHTFRMIGTIRMTNASTFKYRWEFENGTMSDEYTATLSSGSSRIEYDWSFTGNYAPWIRLRVLDPVEVVSEPVLATFNASCTVSAGAGTAGTPASSTDGSLASSAS